MADKHSLEARLKQTEESLRNEVLQSEEQRAYIEMLKDQIDSKIKAIGLSFDAEGGQNRSLDGMRGVPRSNSRLSNGSSNNAAAAAVNRSRVSLNKSTSAQ